MGNGRKKTCQNGTSTLDDIAKEPEKSANLACFSLDEIAKEIGINMVPIRIREDLIDEAKN